MINQRQKVVSLTPGQIPELQQVILELTNIVGSEHVVQSDELGSNTVGIHQEITAQVSPANRDELISILKLANTCQIGVYPVSCGLNIGYGDLVPAQKNQIVVKLDRLNQVFDYDEELGQVSVEPGVTQQLLFEYLRDNQSDYFADMTGAGVNTSVLGNFTDGGIGHSPLGHRRDNIVSLEVVLADGRIVNTCEQPAIGPDPNGLFVQSNFGIVVSLRMNLCKKPDCCEMFVATVDTDNDLAQAVNEIRGLLQLNTITSCVHMGNTVRALVSTRECPPEWWSKPVGNESAKKILANPIVKLGTWNAVGGIYGTRAEIKAKRYAIKKGLSSAKVRFFSAAKLSRLDTLLSTPPLKWLDKNQTGAKGIQSLNFIHGLMSGVPSNQAFGTIAWKVHDPRDTGLIWLAPTTKATGESAQTMLAVCEQAFNRAGFDMPVTLNYAKPNRLVAIIGIHFDKRDDTRRQRAQQLYRELTAELDQMGIGRYRIPTPLMDTAKFHDDGLQQLLSDFKRCIDEKNIIARGRYGLG